MSAQRNITNFPLSIRFSNINQLLNRSQINNPFHKYHQCSPKLPCSSSSTNTHPMIKAQTNILIRSIKATNQLTRLTCTLPLNTWFRVFSFNYSDFLTAKKTIEDDLIETLKGITEIRNKPETSVSQLREQLHMKKK